MEDALGQVSWNHPIPSPRTLGIPLPPSAGQAPVPPRGRDASLTSASSKYTQRVMLCRIMLLLYSSCLHSKDLNSLRSSPESRPCRSRSIARPRWHPTPTPAQFSRWTHKQGQKGYRSRERELQGHGSLARQGLCCPIATSYSDTGTSPFLIPTLQPNCCQQKATKQASGRRGTVFCLIHKSTTWVHESFRHHSVFCS